MRVKRPTHCRPRALTRCMPSGHGCPSNFAVTLTYDLQGGAGQPDDQTRCPGSNVQVSSTVPTREGYTFEGWNTAADGFRH